MSTSQTAVVITCYDLGETLPEALDSVAAQTAKPLETVVVDDGSRDALTRNVIDWLDEYDPQVSVIRSEHRGVAHARNLGIASTTTPHVVLLDGDDLFEATYLEKAEELLRERPDLSFVCCALQAFGRASYRWKPPPYTVADSVGRGACGHISTVFRRGVWESVGGFDEALPAYEDVDFWLRALELGFRGVILDDALLRYRVRHGSRYHGMVVRGEYLRAKQLLLAKHGEAVRQHGGDILVALLDFQRELVGHERALDDERDALAKGRQEVEAEVSEVQEILTSRDLRPFDWGRLDEPLPSAVRRHDAIEDYYATRARQDLDAHGEGNRALVVRAGSPWPDAARARYDEIVVSAALEYEADPAAALKRCRDALRPGGVLLVTASSTALGEERVHGFTELSLRELFCELFDPAHVTARSYGNLLACLAITSGAPLSDLTHEELAVTDPAHPALVAAAARRPRTSRFRASRKAPGGPPRLPPHRAVGSRAAILCYHRIASLRPDTHSLCVPPDLFTTQIELIAKRYQPLALEDLVRHATTGELSEGAVAVTFDDGYMDNMEVASPILAELGVPATFFVSGAVTEEPREGWWDTLERVFVSDEEIPERLGLRIGDTRVELETRTDSQRRAALFALHGRLLEAEGEESAEVAGEVAAWSGLELTVRNSHRLMTASELVELGERPGHHIGAHGLNHLRLPAHPPEVQAAELRDSKSGLERLLEKPVTALAYPYGACEFATTEIAEAAGFAVACTVEGEALTTDSDPLRLPRMEVHAGPLDEFELQLQRLIADAA